MQAPFFTIVATYFSYFMLIVLGHVRDFFGRLLFPASYKHMFPENGRPALFSTSGSFYTRRLYGRIQECWGRPTTGTPGRLINVMIRESHTGSCDAPRLITGEIRKCLNLASYNYLGYAGKFNDQVVKVLNSYPVIQPAPSAAAPACALTRQIEKEIARFLSKESAVVFPMGFATNSCTIPYLVDRTDLVLTDSMNHSSIFFGTHLAPCLIQVFPHNDIPQLEKLIRHHLVQGQLLTHRPFTRVLVIVEGVYSMEGECVKLKEILELKKKYPFFLFVDEAHSIGAMGSTGRGVCEYLGLDFDQVDILMGTFTKSFGAAGGYIAASRRIVEQIRSRSELVYSGEQMSAVVSAQILAALAYLQSPLGLSDLKILRDNAVYFRRALKSLGFVVLGEEESPIVALMLYNPAKISAFSELCLREEMAVVVVGYPATAVISSRVRFCISSAHTKEDLDYAISVVDRVGNALGLKYLKSKK